MKKSMPRAIKLKYEPPQIVDLEEPRLGEGFCATGSGDPAQCDAGNSAIGFGGCQATGNSAGICFTGNSAG